MTASELEEKPALHVRGIRLVELTDRDSSVMKVSESDQCSVWDPVINTFRAFGQCHDLSIMAGVSVVPEDSYADTIVSMTRDHEADLLLIPWSETGTMSERSSGLVVNDASRLDGPFAFFVSSILNQVPGNVGIFLERNLYNQTLPKQPLTAKPSNNAMSVRASAWGNLPAMTRSHHIVFPFFGGADDKFALRFVLQLVQNDQVTATIIHFNIPLSIGEKLPHPGVSWAQDKQSDAVFISTLRDSLPTTLSDRVIFQQLAITDMNPTLDLISLTVTTVRYEMDRASPRGGNIVVVGRCNNKVGPSVDAGLSSQEEIGTETRKVLGIVGESIVRSLGNVSFNVLVLQAGGNGYGLDN